MGLSVRLKGLAAPASTAPAVPTAPTAPTAPTEIVLFDHEDRLVGRLRFRVCPACRTGRVLDIWTGDGRRNQGLGRRLTRSLLACHPGHRWTTTLQTREGRDFFRSMSEETGVPLPQGGPLCGHLTGALRRSLRSLLER